MAAIWQWLTINADTTNDDGRGVGWAAHLTYAMPSGWNLQRIIYSGVNQATPADAIGDTEYYVTIGTLNVAIGVMRGPNLDVPSIDRYFPCTPWQVQASRIAKNMFWNAVMSTPEMYADISLRRTHGTVPADELGVFLNYGYDCAGLDFPIAGRPNMRHETKGILKILLSKPA